MEINGTTLDFSSYFSGSSKKETTYIKGDKI